MAIPRGLGYLSRSSGAIELGGHHHLEAVRAHPVMIDFSET